MKINQLVESTGTLGYKQKLDQVLDYIKAQGIRAYNRERFRKIKATLTDEDAKKVFIEAAKIVGKTTKVKFKEIPFEDPGSRAISIYESCLKAEKYLQASKNKIVEFQQTGHFEQLDEFNNLIKGIDTIIDLTQKAAMIANAVQATEIYIDFEFREEIRSEPEDHVKALRKIMKREFNV